MQTHLALHFYNDKLTIRQLFDFGKYWRASCIEFIIYMTLCGYILAMKLTKGLIFFGMGKTIASIWL